MALLFKSACIDDRDIHYRAALMFASVNNDSAMVSLLLGFGADVDSCADIGWMSLCAACSLGHTKVVGLLLEARANANQRRVARCQCHCASRFLVAGRLLGAGADKYVVDHRGDTARSLALMRGQTDVLRLLLRD